MTQPLPYLSEMDRSCLLVQLREMPPEEGKRIKRATLAGQALDSFAEQRFQYAILGQSRSMRRIGVYAMPVLVLLAILRALTNLSSVAGLIAVVIYAVPWVIITLQYVRMRRLEKALGLTNASFATHPHQ